MTDQAPPPAPPPWSSPEPTAAPLPTSPTASVASPPTNPSVAPPTAPPSTNLLPPNPPTSTLPPVAPPVPPGASPWSAPVVPGPGGLPPSGPPTGPPGMSSAGTAAPSSGGGGSGRGGIRSALIGGLVGAIVAGGVTAAALWDRSGTTTVATPLTAPGRPSATLSGPQLDIQALLDKVSPSVVSIHTGVRGGEAAGSGVIISADGVILTNAHVVEGAESIEVDLSDGRTAEARLLGAVPDNDVAVIKAEGLQGPVTPADLGSSGELQVGDAVVAIGNALNLGEEPSVTTGIVSALNRSITAPAGNALDDLIQTDAAINPGNSGGPLINSRGQVVGINTAILANAQNIGFALSIDSIRSIVKDLEAGKQVQASKPLLGVETVNVTGLSSDVVSRFGVTASAGAFVQRVSPGSGAAGAGLQQGDVIVAIDGKRIRTNEDVGQVVRSKQPGDRIEITYERRGEQQTGTATLGQR